MDSVDNNMAAWKPHGTAQHTVSHILNNKIINASLKDGFEAVG